MSTASCAASGAPAATAAELAPGRSADPPTDRVPRPHRKQNQRRVNREPHRTSTRSTTTAAGRHCHRAGNALAPSAGRGHGADRSDLVPGRRRIDPARRPPAGAAAQTGRLPRSAEDARPAKAHGLVWVPKLAKEYSKSGNLYGKGEGEFMPEAEAQKAGNHEKT
jgi:hypothetical protein